MTPRERFIRALGGLLVFFGVGTLLIEIRAVLTGEVNFGLIGIGIVVLGVAALLVGVKLLLRRRAEQI